MMSLEGRTALVTGASSGLGAAFARRLAAQGASLCITARREEQLQALAHELSEQHGVRVDVIVADLATPNGPRELFAATESRGLHVDVLVNNAGFGTHREFVGIPWEVTARQLQLNIVSLTQLTRLYLPSMLAWRAGHILNVASVGAYTPTPFYSTYAAGKAYVRDFTEALASELADSPVRVCCLCPGATTTEFQASAGQDVPGFLGPLFMPAEKCARIGLEALFAGRRNVVAGVPNKLGMQLLRVLPRRSMVWLARQSMGVPGSS